MSLDDLVLSQQDLPKHVGIIMDGNGRWAEKQGKPRVWGHKNGVEAVRSAVRFCRTHGIQSLTLFAFSSENWRRPEDEVNTLMELFMMVLTKEVKRLHKNDVRLKLIGDTSRFSSRLQDKIANAEALTAQNKGLLTLNIAANYGGQWDIVNAAKNAVAELQANGEPLDLLTEERFSEHLSLAEQPALDLLIRTGGDFRISNFLIWQAAYSELYFTDVLWPDFDENAFLDAIRTYIERERRFGCTGKQVKEMLEKSGQ